MNIVLNNQQEECIIKALKWFRNISPDRKQTFEISGPAGSGKTTIVKEIIKELGLDMANVLFVAFVGKAALQLSRSGVEGRTIHSVFYDVDFVPVKDEYGKNVMRNGKLVKRPLFRLKQSLPSYVKLIVVDEGPMVNDEIGKQMESFGIPMIILGDLQQLPPVMGNTHYLKRPDYVLTKIMRQKEGDPIIYISQLAARGEHIPYGRYGDKCFVIPKTMLNDDMLREADMVLTPKNSSRVKLNKYIRENIHGYTNALPVYGEKLICRKNNRQRILGNNMYLVNGMTGFVDNIEKSSFNGKTLDIDFKPDFETDKIFRDLRIDYKALTSSITLDSDYKKGYSMFEVFEYGYAMTVHLSQGSQSDNVIFISEPFGNREMQCRINYTAATRAKEGLIMAY